MNEQGQSLNATANLLPFRRYLESLEVSAATGWRWRENGWIETVSIANRLYVTRAAIRRFEQRAAAGDFLRRRAVPRNRHVPNTPPSRGKKSEPLS